MKINELDHAFDKKDWSSFSQILDNLINLNLSIEENFEIFSIVSKIDNEILKNIFKQNPKLNYMLWIFCNKIGKVSYADRFADQYLSYLIERKKIIQLKKYINELEVSGSLKKKLKKIKLIPATLLGNKENFHKLKSYIELSDWHIEYWGEDYESLKDNIMESTDFKKEDLKLLFKFILKFKFDPDLIIKLLEYKNLSQDEYIKIENFLKNKKVLKSIPELSQSGFKALNSKIDYDQIAFELISGKKELDINVEEKIINSLNYMTEEEISMKGYDMLIAFRLLEMNKVTMELCEKLLQKITDTKLYASVIFVKAQTLIELDESYKAIDIVDDAILKLPLLNQELSAFWYLKYLAYKQLGKNNQAEQIIKNISKMDSGFKASNLRNI